MSTRFTSYFAVLVIFLSSSCQTYIKIPAPTSPTLELDEQTHRIAFINRYDYTLLPYNNENKNEVLEKGARQVIHSLEKSFDEEAWLELVLADTLARGLALNSFPELLMPDYVVSTCNLHDVDLLLLFEFFDASFSTETETIEYDDGSRSNTNFVDLIVAAGFSLYQSDGVLIDRIKVTDTKFYQERPALSRWVSIGPAWKEAGDEVNEQSATLGYNYIDNFYPGYETVLRLVYTGSDFSEVTQLMKRQQWDEAIELLLPLAHSPDQKLAKKAAHNLSLCLGAVGRVSDADYWMNKANEK